MQKNLILGILFSVSLVACGGTEDKKPMETKPAASAPATPQAATPQTATPVPTQAPAPTPAPATTQTTITETGPLADLARAACQCKTPECGTKILDDLVALAKADTKLNLQTEATKQLNQCVLSSGVDRNQFITKIRQLNQQN